MVDVGARYSRVSWRWVSKVVGLRMVTEVKEGGEEFEGNRQIAYNTQ